MILTLPDFVFINSKEIPGADLILYTPAPCYIFGVQKFETDLEMSNFIRKNELDNLSIQTSGYYILIYYTRLLVPTQGDSKAALETDIKNHLDKARIFYERERIKGNETRLKKFLEKE